MVTTHDAPHSEVLHERRCHSLGQGAPSVDGAVATLRVRCCVPLSHDIVQLLHDPHCVTPQSTMQLCVLQMPSSFTRMLCEQARMIAGVAWISKCRVRIFLPPPHVIVHGPHALHLLTGHSMVRATVASITVRARAATARSGAMQSRSV